MADEVPMEVAGLFNVRCFVFSGATEAESGDTAAPH